MDIASASTIEHNEDLEAREDSLELIRAFKEQERIKIAVTADVETSAIQAGSMDDAADDPAIWMNPQDVLQSRVYGSNKKGGIAVYDLSGNEFAYYPTGKINNVDVLYNYNHNGENITLLGSTNRTTQSIDIHKILEDGQLLQFESGSFRIDTTIIDDVYGFCFAQNEDKSYAVVNGKNGVFHQFEIISDGDSLALELKRQLQFSDQTEGMVADKVSQLLFVGEENKGVHVIKINPEDTSRYMILESNAAHNEFIEYDIEGLSVYRKDDIAWLIVSSQGNFSYAVFDINNELKYLGSFKIVDGERIDGVEETDGLDIVAHNLGEQYPQGIVVLQDGFNYDGEVLTSQNFKYVSMEKVLSAFKTRQ